MRYSKCRFCLTRWSEKALDCPTCQDRKPLTKVRAKVNLEAIYEGNIDLLREFHQSRKRTDGLVRALEFYADVDQWSVFDCDDPDGIYHHIVIRGDSSLSGKVAFGGEKAREALARFESEQGE